MSWWAFISLSVVSPVGVKIINSLMPHLQSPSIHLNWAFNIVAKVLSWLYDAYHMTLAAFKKCEMFYSHYSTYSVSESMRTASLLSCTRTCCSNLHLTWASDRCNMWIALYNLTYICEHDCSEMKWVFFKTQNHPLF